MPNDAEMTIDERRKYLKRMQGRYWAAEGRERNRLLTEMELVTGLHRRSVVRLVSPHGPGLARRQRAKQRGREYGHLVDDVLRVVWESLDYVCAERLTPALVPTARLLARHGEVRLTDPLEAQLAQISRASVQRRLTRFVQDVPRLPRRGPERANRVNQVLRTVPMQRIAWDEPAPGHFEVDLVHHSGPLTDGDYVHTLQLIDVATGWSERVAVLGRSQRAMEAGFRRVLDRLPFAVRELHPDNGSEFFNNHLVRFWGEAITGLTLSRSRPYQKNDNRFVEQKNDSLVRAYLGQVRLETLDQCAALNALYDQLWTYYNLFQPVLHLVEKRIDPAMPTRVHRKWDAAQTPFARLCATDALPVPDQARLEGLRERTNPRALRHEIYAGLARLRAPQPLVIAPPASAETQEGWAA